MTIPLGKRLNKTYQPPSGFGGFDTNYIVGSGEMLIKVRVKIQWLPAENGDNWDVNEQNTFRQKLVDGVKETWSDKWKFRCTVKDFNELVRPIFELEITDNDPHFTFVCHNKQGQAHLRPNDAKVYLFKNDVDGIDERGDPKTLGMSAGGVMAAARKKVENILIPVQNVAVSRDTGVWKVTPDAAADIVIFAREINRIHPDSPRYPLIIEASSGIANKARDMVDAVHKLLKVHGVTNYPITPSPTRTSKKFKNIFSHTPKQDGTVTIRLADDDNAVRQEWVYRYKAAVHEFGHCLGLPDEYEPQYPGRIGTQAHDAWRTLCNSAGVSARPCPKFDASIMSCGWMMYPCHYVTVWDALGKMTGPFIKPNEWKIERGTEPDSL